MKVIKEKMYYTVPEAAEILRISIATLHRKMKAGSIKKRKTGGRILFTLEDIKSAVVEVLS